MDLRRAIPGASQDAEFFRRTPTHLVGDRSSSVAVRAYGAGEPLVFIHGFPLHGFTYRKILPRLAEHFRCLVVDVPGAGDSHWSDSTDFSFPAQANRLRSALRKLGVDRYSVVAHDTGASLARHLAVMDAARLEKLVLLNTEMPGHRPPWIPLYGQLMKLPGSVSVLRGLLRSESYVRSSAGFGGCFQDPACLDEEFRAAFIAPLIASGHRARGYSRYLQGFDWRENDAMREKHGRISSEVLFLWGENDPTFPVALGRRMASEFPACVGFETIAGTKLLPHEEKPDEVCAHVFAFLKGSEQKRRAG
jgi:haloalkane dehalogenase